MSVTIPCPCPPGTCPAPDPYDGGQRPSLEGECAALGRRVAHLRELGLVRLERERVTATGEEDERC